MKCEEKAPGFWVENGDKEGPVSNHTVSMGNPHTTVIQMKTSVAALKDDKSTTHSHGNLTTGVLRLWRPKQKRTVSPTMHRNCPVYRFQLLRDQLTVLRRSKIQHDQNCISLSDGIVRQMIGAIRTGTAVEY
ncbi:hypothetical protein F2P81_004807 [Scophthalmus maximus]|uniref:Uncharacterized protein n=1 Tax=Scophthalmus maximus TaxID=52904 RepID=A0A6A4TIE6_SCOMX|nr:hypothetical protein F2P81_004807 [Scophthalmus maximus]